MADFSKLKPSSNFEDRTAWTPHDYGVQEMRDRVNPVRAYRLIRSTLIDKGVINPGPFRLGLPKVGGK